MKRRIIKLIFVAFGLGYLISPDLVPGLVDDIGILILEALIYSKISKKK